MNDQLPSRADAGDDWLDGLLRADGGEHRAGYLDDDGFTARVMSALPAPAALPAWRKPALLRQVFALCATMPAQIVSLQKLQGRLRDPVVPVLSCTGELVRTRTAIEAATDAVYAAMSTLRNDPDQPLPSTIWPQLQALPWPWIAAGVGGLVLAGILFQRQGTR